MPLAVGIGNFPDKKTRLLPKTGKESHTQQPREKLSGAVAVQPIIEMTDNEKIDCVAARILKKYRKAFEELAK